MALVPCLTKHVLRENQDYVPGESEYSSTPIMALCPCFAQSSVMVEEPGPQGGLCLRPFHPEKPSTRCPHSWELAGPQDPGEGVPDEG